MRPPSTGRESVTDSIDPKPAGKLALQIQLGYLLLLLLSASFGFLLYTGEILFAVILLVLAILLVTVFEYTYIRPLEEVCDAAKRLGDKDFSAKAPNFSFSCLQKKTSRGSGWLKFLLAAWIKTQCCPAPGATSPS